MHAQNTRLRNTEDVDLLVLGAGAAGMTAALTGAVLGMRVALVEKTDQVGGTSALSAGSVWAPASHHSPPGQDSFDEALTYLRNAVGERLDEELASAFLRAAPEMVRFLEDHDCMEFRAYPYHPDYLANLEGAKTSGRVLEALPFDGDVLGRRFGQLRPPLPEFTLFGGMMVDRGDIAHLMSAFRSAKSFMHTVRLLCRFGKDRLRFPRGTRLKMGNALTGRLFQALCRRNVPLLMSTETLSLTMDKGRISGAELRQGGDTRHVAASAGVILATGGISHHPELRASLMPETLSQHSTVTDGATGDGYNLATRHGARLGELYGSNSFWAPVSQRTRRDGSIAVFPHFVLDRGKPGAIAVNPAGQRFVNEATTYHLFGEALLSMAQKFPGQPCHVICDDRFMEKHGLGMVRPKKLNLKATIADGYIRSADTLPILAKKIGVPEEALDATVSQNDKYASTGKDVEFGKGEDAYQQNLGDPDHLPNPCLGPVATPPYHALEIRAGDIGASAGLVTDSSARVLNVSGTPIEGLYACGNDMASIMAGRYPGPGITLGPAMAFAWLAARHAHAHASKANS